MPIYEYRCPKCGNRFEELIMKKSDEAEVKCGKCGYEKPSRELSNFSAGSGSGQSTSSSCSAPSGFS
jgi:putative FmdB family regulatory protein